MKIEVVGIDEIKEYELNAKEHPREQIEQIKKSILDFGNNDPIAIDSNGEIIEGHGRYIALKELGFDEVEVIILGHLTEEQKKAYRLIHNKLTMNSDFDFELLEQELKELTAFDFNMEDFGFDTSDFEDFKPQEIEEDNFDVEAAAEQITEPITKEGDIWQLGNHRLMCGDSTNEEDVVNLMNGNKADLLLTDPPYNVAYEGGTKEKLTIDNDDMSDGDFLNFLCSAFLNADSVMREGAAFYIWHADSEGFNFRSACKQVGWDIRQCLIWAKNSLVLGRQDYQWKHEPCLYGWKSGAAHYFINDRTQSTILEFNKPARNGEHPTMKPVDLFARIINNSSKKNELVLDLFGGSGTSIIASEQLNRNCYSMEYSPKYCDVIIKRWEELTGQKAELIKNIKEVAV